MIAVWCEKCRRRVERYVMNSHGVTAWCHGDIESWPVEAVETGPTLTTLRAFKEPKEGLTDDTGRGTMETGGDDGVS